MTKMAARPIYGKNLLKILFSRAKADDLGSLYVAIGELGLPSADPGGGGTGGPDPPGKSQVIWVSIGNYNWTPLENVGLPLEP